MNKKEYTQITEDIATTQKLIRTWVSQGINIEIIHQEILPLEHTNGIPHIFTSLWRIK